MMNLISSGSFDVSSSDIVNAILDLLALAKRSQTPLQAVEAIPYGFGFFTGNLLRSADDFYGQLVDFGLRIH